MGQLDLVFRGIFTVVLNQPGGQPKSARFLLPNGYTPRLAFGNEEVTIPPFFPFIAIPIRQSGETLTLAKTTRDGEPVAPNLICALDAEQHPTAPAVDVAAQFRAESVRADEGLALGVAAAPEPLYALFFIPNHEVVIRQGKAKAGITWNSDAVDLVQPAAGAAAIPKATSMRWGADFADFATGARVRADCASGSTPPKECAAFLDLESGEIVPLHDRDGHVHVWRFMNSRTTFRREISDGVRATIDTDSSVTIVLRNRNAEDDDIEITLDMPDDRATIVIGNEPLVDILGVGPMRSCSDPAYHFELHYQLFEPGLERLPVPVCAEEDDDHRDPPRAKCGPYGIVVQE